MSTPIKPRPKGLSMIEVLLVVALLGILAALAMPSFSDFIDSYRLKGAADNLYSDLQFARMEAVRTNQSVYLSFASGASWCYGMNLGTSCSCVTSRSCNLKLVASSDVKGATLSSATFSTASFDPQRGLASAAGTAVMQSGLGKQAQVGLSLLGTVTICTPTGAKGVGYSSC